MEKVNSYSVADFGFTVAGMPFEPANLRPFRVPEVPDPVFNLQIVPELSHGSASLLYQTDDGPGFPEITLYQYPNPLPGGAALRVEVSPLPGRPIASRMDISANFQQAWLKLEEKDDAFGINNSLMLLYAFATARLGALEMHASVVVKEGKGFLFLGRSGTGKSTHSRLWLKYIPGTELLNDDNPILRLMPDSRARVYGSPWSGKTPCYKQQSAEVGAVVRLSQAPQNQIRRLELVNAYASLMASASSFRPFRDLADGWHCTLEGLASTVPCYHLDCLPDQAAAELCFDTVYE